MIPKDAKFCNDEKHNLIDELTWLANSDLHNIVEPSGSLWEETN